MNHKMLIHPNILLGFADLGFSPSLNIDDLISRFDRLELVYFALEIIYNRELSIGYEKICSRLFPNDNGQTIKSLLDKEFPYLTANAINKHLVCVQTGLELLKILFSKAREHKPCNFDSLCNGAQIKGTYLLTILLLVNDRITSKNIIDEKNFNDDASCTDLIANTLAHTLVANNDYTNYDIVTYPLLLVYKSTLFLEFCKDNAKLSSYLKNVLKEYKCADTRTFITVILSIFMECYNGYELPYKYKFSDTNPAPEFFNRLSLSIDTIVTEGKNVDYSSFRARPLIQVSPNEFVVICFPFLFDKLYNSLIFDLSNVSGHGDKIRQIISTEFSEKILLFPLLKKSIAPKSPFCLTGEECYNIQKDSAPDFYVRNWNSIFLFELKDYSFRAVEKTSMSYNALSTYLYNPQIRNRLQVALNS